MHLYFSVLLHLISKCQLYRYYFRRSYVFKLFIYFNSNSSCNYFTILPLIVRSIGIQEFIALEFDVAAAACRKSKVFMVYRAIHSHGQKLAVYIFLFTLGNVTRSETLDHAAWFAFFPKKWLPMLRLNLEVGCPYHCVLVIRSEKTVRTNFLAVRHFNRELIS